LQKNMPRGSICSHPVPRHSWTSSSSGSGSLFGNRRNNRAEDIKMESFTKYISF
jgi:hypothetical protein